MVLGPTATDIKRQERAWRRETARAAERRLDVESDTFGKPKWMILKEEKLKAARAKLEKQRKRAESSITKRERWIKQLEKQINSYRDNARDLFGIENILDEKFAEKYGSKTPNDLVRELSPKQLQAAAKEISGRMTALQDRIVTVLETGLKELSYLRNLQLSDYQAKIRLLTKAKDGERITEAEGRVIERSIGRKKLDAKGMSLLKKQIAHDEFLEEQQKKAVAMLGKTGIKKFDLVKLRNRLEEFKAEARKVTDFYKFLWIFKRSPPPVRSFRLWRRPLWVPPAWSNKYLRELARLSKSPIIHPFTVIRKEHMKFIIGIDNILRRTDQWD